MSRCDWLGTRHTWRQINTDGFRGRATLVAYNPERLPWLNSERLIVASINHDNYMCNWYNVSSLDCEFWRKPVVLLMTPGNASIATIGELLQWPSAEAVYSEYVGKDLAESYPSSMFALQLAAIWRTQRVRGWWMIDRCRNGISLVHEMSQAPGCTYTVEVTDRSVAIHRGTLAECSAFAENTLITTIAHRSLEMTRLMAYMPKHEAIGVRSMVRRYRLWLYDCAFLCDLPF